MNETERVDWLEGKQFIDPALLRSLIREAGIRAEGRLVELYVAARVISFARGGMQYYEGNETIASALGVNPRTVQRMAASSQCLSRGGDNGDRRRPWILTLATGDRIGTTGDSPVRGTGDRSGHDGRQNRSGRETDVSPDRSKLVKSGVEESGEKSVVKPPPAADHHQGVSDHPAGSPAREDGAFDGDTVVTEFERSVLALHPNARFFDGNRRIAPTVVGQLKKGGAKSLADLRRVFEGYAEGLTAAKVAKYALNVSWPLGDLPSLLNPPSIPPAPPMKRYADRLVETTAGEVAAFWKGACKKKRVEPTDTPAVILAEAARMVEALKDFGEPHRVTASAWASWLVGKRGADGRNPSIAGASETWKDFKFVRPTIRYERMAAKNEAKAEERLRRRKEAAEAPAADAPASLFGGQEAAPSGRQDDREGTPPEPWWSPEDEAAVMEEDRLAREEAGLPPRDDSGGWSGTMLGR